MLGPLVSAAAETVAIKIPLSDHTYYLIENRQPVGYDRNLKGSGVLILYADDRIAECRRGESAGKTRECRSGCAHTWKARRSSWGKKSVFEDRKNRIRIDLWKRPAPAIGVRIHTP